MWKTPIQKHWDCSILQIGFSNLYSWLSPSLWSFLFIIIFVSHTQRFNATAQEPQVHPRHSLWSILSSATTRWAHLWGPQGGCHPGSTAGQDGDGVSTETERQGTSEGKSGPNMGASWGLWYLTLSFKHPSSIQHPNSRWKFPSGIKNISLNLLPIPTDVCLHCILRSTFQSTFLEQCLTNLTTEIAR